MATASENFAIAAAALLAEGKNNFDLIKIIRVEADKARAARRAKRAAKPVQNLVTTTAQNAPAAAPKPAAQKVA